MPTPANPSKEVKPKGLSKFVKAEWAPFLESESDPESDPEPDPEPKTKWRFPDAQAEARARRANLNVRPAARAARRDASAPSRTLGALRGEVEGEVEGEAARRRLALEESFFSAEARRSSSCRVPRYVPGAALELGDTDAERARIEYIGGDTDTDTNTTKTGAAAAAALQGEDKEGPCAKKKKKTASESKTPAPEASSASCKRSTRGGGRAVVERERMETDPKAVRESMESSSSTSLSEAEWSDEGQEWPRPRDSLAEWADLGDEGGPDESS
ncbi:hypothetical protein Hte_002221 [Hypoxylon texense]